MADHSTRQVPMTVEDGVSSGQARVALTDPWFAALLDRHLAFWQRAPENSLLCSTGVFASSQSIGIRQPDGSLLMQAEHLEPGLVDPTVLIDEVEAWDASRLDATLILQGQVLVAAGLGDLLPYSRPLATIPWLEAMLGCPIKMTDGRIWVGTYEGDPEEVIERASRIAHDPWFHLYLEFLRQLQDRLGQRFPPSTNTLLRGPSDLVAAVLGVDMACAGWIDRPAFMARLMRACTQAILTFVEAGNRTLEPFHDGYICGYQIWAPAPIVRTQADHSFLISPRMYERQILPYDLEIIRCCPMSIFHVHNGGLHIAPFLVGVEELDAIQVEVDPYPSGERKATEIEMLRRIQEHKPLILRVNCPSLEEADWLLAQLSPRGLCFMPRFAVGTYATISEKEVWLLE